jgi:hypothetical protein
MRPTIVIPTPTSPASVAHTLQTVTDIFDTIPVDLAITFDNLMDSSDEENAIPIPPRTAGGNTPAPPRIAALGTMSPATTAATLKAFPTIDADTLRNMLEGLLLTVEKREAQHAQTIGDVHERNELALLAAKRELQDTEDRLEAYENTFDETPPQGYVLNDGKVPGFHIPVGCDGLYQPAKWVRNNCDGTVSGYTGEQGHTDEPYTITLYAAPDTSEHSYPITALPVWLRHLLLGPSADFATLRDFIAEMELWGLTAEIDRYRKLDLDITGLGARIELLQRDLTGLQSDLLSSENRLSLTRLANKAHRLRGLPRKVSTTHDSWSAKPKGRGRPL